MVFLGTLLDQMREKYLRSLKVLSAIDIDITFIFAQSGHTLIDVKGAFRDPSIIFL